MVTFRFPLYEISSVGHRNSAALTSLIRKSVREVIRKESSQNTMYLKQQGVNYS